MHFLKIPSIQKNIDFFCEKVYNLFKCDCLPRKEGPCAYMKKIITVANAMTAFRIVGSLCLIFISYDTVAFFILYSLCGLSDALDGFVARRTNSVTPLGSKLDSIADLTFYSVMCYKILPILMELLPLWLWIMTFSVIFVRILAYVAAAIRFKRFASIHTYLNKATGLMLFAMPYMLKTPMDLVYCIIACAVAMASSAEELLIHVLSPNYSDKNKSVFMINK